MYSALTAAMVVLVATIALNAQQPPPPAVAELSPQSVEQIKKANTQQDTPTDQQGGSLSPTPSAKPSSSAGRGATPTSTPTNVPADRRCYGGHQTEDPQSPPCVSFYDPAKNDNGGATSFGVTKDQITIGWPQNIEQARDTEDLATYFNRRFEFYGRKIVLKPYGPRGGAFGGVNASDMQADADFVHDQQQAFASLAYVPRQGTEHHYYDRLAQLKIVGVNSHASSRTEAGLSKWAPYEWGYLPAYDTMMRNYAEFICKSLAGRPPKHGGTGISNLSTPRKFGLVYHVAADGSSPDRAVFTDALKASCNVAPVVITQYTDPQQTILTLKTNSVTTVVCICWGDQYFTMMPEATKQAWFPEWLVSSYGYLDYDSAAQKYPQEQSLHAFGISFHNKWLPEKQMPWYEAIKEVDPDYETGDNGFASAIYERYYELLVLASGIQMAGPHLTPQTFQEGLFRARFPESGSGRAPLYYSGGGFGPSDHTMVDDAAMVWYSESDMGYTTNVRRGTFCYVKDGLRYGLGQWPSGDPAFFQEPCGK
ncbi:MAG: hypothetical protein NVSMB57_00070 [Actinomycetota bacterium]